MLRSLSVKLILAFLLVALTGTLLAAFFVNQRTAREFDRFVANRYEADLLVELTRRYQEFGSWEGFDSIVVRGRHDEVVPAPVTLLDTDRRVIYSPIYPAGQQLSAQESRQALPVKDGGETVGWVLFPRAEAQGINPNSPEATFLRSVQNAILWGSLVAVLVALLLGIFLARTLTHPLRELTEATRSLARGALGQQVPVRSSDELGELTASFNQMSADLAQSVQQRRQMTADIAHDLRTPLSVILGYTEALSDGKIPGAPEIYTVIHGEAQHLQRLIEDLRILSLADAGELTLNRQQMSPAALLERTAAAYTVKAQEKEIDLRMEVSEDLPRISVDPERMAQVLGNLVSNAIRHTPHGGHVVLSADAKDGRVFIHVQDSGEGIAPEDLPHIFNRFYRGNAARVQIEGESGLGLAIVRSLIEAHGGAISVESTPNIGTIFTATLAAV
ncbi:MAG: HAMP domain-containing histidine kinase [Caldilineaceae bacterium]|nr:HAMP domain-containing histidine kinase [Caldilineaceae bacterium]